MYLIPVLFKFYIQGVLKFKKYYSGAKRLNTIETVIKRIQFEIKNKKSLITIIIFCFIINKIKLIIP